MRLLTPLRESHVHVAQVRRRTHGRAYLYAVLVVGLAAATPAAQRVPSLSITPFKVGEVLSYDISWSTYLTAGSATLSVNEHKPSGSPALYDLVAEGRPVSLLDKLYHIYYKAESLLAKDTLQPSMSTVFSDERGRAKLRTTTFIGPTAVDFQPKVDAPAERKKTPPLAKDPLSAIYVMRSLPLDADKVFTMPIVDGRDVYNAAWRVGAPEQVKTPAGTFPAWRITPTLTTLEGKPMANYRITVWLSNDARRLPLKLEAGLAVGNFVLTLNKIAE
jgi:hypothetical protein